MSLKLLNIHHLRGISSASLNFNPKYNIIFGCNGSGKTSLLEAIHLLGTGRSFCTNDTSSLVQDGESTLTVYANTFDNQSISIQKAPNKPTLVKLNQRPCLRSSELAQFLPCQSVYQDIFQIIDEGPSTRRSILDWGLFHVKPAYHELWKNYRRVIKQRNTLLRQKAPANQFTSWNTLLVQLSIEIDTLRQDYCSEWSQYFEKTLKQLTNVPCTFTYYKGWDRKGTGKSLQTILHEQFERDFHSQYTHSGAHQADIVFNSNLLSAKQQLSRGQQKIILIALKFAQSCMLQKPCVYLLDDVSAELDSIHLQRLIEYIQQVEGQFFLTTTDSDFYNRFFLQNNSILFSVNHGCFT